jgi:hypothetical protein
MSNKQSIYSLRKGTFGLYRKYTTQEDTKPDQTNERQISNRSLFTENHHHHEQKRRKQVDVRNFPPSYRNKIQPTNFTFATKLGNEADI